MLKRVAIKGFRSCHDVVLDNLGPLTVLVGRNAVGKSNILRAISWLAETATSVPPPRHFLEPGEVTVQVILGRDTYDYSFEVVVHSPGSQPSPDIDFAETLQYRGSDGVPRDVFKRGAGKITIDGQVTINVVPLTPSLPALDSLLPPNSERVRLVRPLLENLRAIRYYPVETDADLGPTYVRDSDYQEWLAQRRRAKAPVAELLMRLVDMNLKRPDEFEELKRLLGPNGLGLIDSIGVDPLGPAPMPDKREQSIYSVSFRPGSQPATSRRQFFSLDDLSSGTQRVLGILTSLIYDHSSVMLLEHPEESLHEGLLWKLIGILQGYSEQSQVIIASHSAAVFNAVPPEAIRLVTMEEGETKVRHLSRQELGAAATYLKEEGTLADFLEMVAED
jgi:predicted ATPase